MNKKILMVSLMVIAMLVMTVSVVLAQTINVDSDIPVGTDLVWDGSGYVSIDVTVDDDVSTYFRTGGSHIFGSLHINDYGPDRYGYNVNTYDAGVYATVEGGGYIEFGTLRTDSKESMYGPAGQVSESYIDTSDYAFMGWKTSTNYASLADCQYSWQSSDNFVVSGEDFEYGHRLLDGAGDGSEVYGWGSGSVEIDIMNSKTGGSSFTFGKGCGCYLNCDAEGTGSGYFAVEAWADNYLKGDLGYELPDGGSAFFDLSYNDGFSQGSFASTGN